jgi:hypothetical protein
MLRFSLTTLLLLMLFACVGCAALVHATELWRQTIVTVTVVILLFAMLTAASRSGASQRFPLGFALAGWIYVLLVFVAAHDLRQDLLTERALTWLFAAVHDEVASEKLWLSNSLALSMQGRVLTASSNPRDIRLWDLNTGRQVKSRFGPGVVNYEDFADIGHCLWAVMIACAGGVVARILAAHPSRSAPSTGRDEGPMAS